MAPDVVFIDDKGRSFSTPSKVIDRLSSFGGSWDFRWGDRQQIAVAEGAGALVVRAAMLLKGRDTLVTYGQYVMAFRVRDGLIKKIWFVQ